MKIVILAGGSGTRLWPLSRQSLPKQFLHFGESHSLLQKTLLRFLKIFSPSDLLIITNQDYYHLVKQQAIQIDPHLLSQIVIEPEKRSTAPAICLAVAVLQEKMGARPEECFLVSSSDHLISPETLFLEKILEAEKVAAQGHHVIFGIRPSKPETGYGYIRSKQTEKSPTLSVLEFIEKPSKHLAEQFLVSGDYFWNAGIFLFQIATFLEDLCLHQEEMHRLALQGPAKLLEGFHLLPELSIDYALLEYSSRIQMMPLDLSWSDIGSWDGVYEVLSKDSFDNVKLGTVLDIGTRSCLLMSEKRLLATVDVEDLIVIDSDDALLIAKKGQSQKVKLLVETLKEKGSKAASEHRTIYRPWGSYTILEEGERYKIKRITVDPGQKLSLQLHYHRSEHWVVVKGAAKVTVDDKEVLLHENESIYVPKSTTHRLENPGKVSLELIEVQVGEYVGEDDIVRFDDVYGRVEVGQL
jgi:mannose-1-phosphate guanylyltransferase/mannose-6-phosphate isomerase